MNARWIIGFSFWRLDGISWMEEGPSRVGDTRLRRVRIRHAPSER